MSGTTRTEIMEFEDSGTSSGNRRFSSLRRIPRSWLIAAILFYCISLITVGLLAGLLPKRTKYVTVVVTVTPPITEDSTSTTTTTTTPAASMTTTTTTTTSMMTTSQPSGCIDNECNPRLVTDIVVNNYELEYYYNDTQQTVANGLVTISFVLRQPTYQLIYHGKRLMSLETPVVFENGVQRLVTMRVYPPNDYISLRLTTNTSFPPNRYQIVQKFAVNLVDGNVGFFRSEFKDEDGSTSQLLSTKFEPTDARKAFPCFDEPHLKATFELTIYHPENTIALGNFPVVEEIKIDNLRRTTFSETFLMSTYLAAWAILPETYGRRTDDDDEPMFTVWARSQPTIKNHTALAIQIATESLAVFNDYFNISDAVPPKIDLLAVPNYPTEAMENWGLITFREDALIYDEKVVSTKQKQELCDTIAHELAHMWVGNYVTCKWWTDLWLNEAMASWLAFKPFNEKYPQWKLELQILTDSMIPVMWDDAKPSSHPIAVKNISDAAQITSLFDSITYSKGASVLRMLERMVGSNRFRDALREYLMINALDVGDPTVFYNKLFDDISGEEFMKNWLEEQNYPILNVDLRVEGGNTRVIFTQTRFIISNFLNTSGLDPNYRWKIPLKCVLGGNYPNDDTVNVGGDTIEFLFDGQQDTRTLTGKTYSWIKCNQDFQGFYLTEYLFESKNWERFSAVIEENPNFFSDEDKTNLLHDSFLLSYKSRLNYSQPLIIFRSLIRINTQRFVHWRTFQWHWENLAHLVDYLPDLLPKFQDFAIQQILSNGNSLDKILTIQSTDDHETRLLKSLQFEFLCRMNHTESIQRATTLFRSIPKEYFNNENVEINVPSDFLSTVYKYHLKSDDNEADWNLMYNYYKNAISPQEQSRALFAISSTPNATRLNRLLNDGLNPGPETIRSQDYFSLMEHIALHPVGRNTVWTFYKNNYQKLIDTFKLENRQFGASILKISRSFENDTFLQEMNELFKQFPNPGAGALARQQAQDQVKMNIEWIQYRESNLRNALNTIHS